MEGVQRPNFGPKLGKFFGINFFDAVLRDAKNFFVDIHLKV